MASKTETPGQPEVTSGQPQQVNGIKQGHGEPAGYTVSNNRVHPVEQSGHVIVQNPDGPPPDYLALSVIACCFCWPLALIACVFSNNSNTASKTGNYSKAESDGQTARNIAIAAIIIGLILTLVLIIYRIA